MSSGRPSSASSTRQPGLVCKLTAGLLRVYQQAVSPYLPPACRFLPTCSEYSRQAFQRYPAPRAAWKSIRRLLRCHPLTRGGFDPLE